MRNINVVEKQADVLIIGGGFAGVFASLRARSKGKSVILVDKGDVGRSGQTPWADSFHVFDEKYGKTKEDYKRIIKYKGLGVSNTGFLDMVLDESRDIFTELESWGATHDPRFGKIFKKKVIESGTEVIVRTMITELIKDEEEDRIIGAVGFMLDEDNTAVVIEAKAVINCAGAGSYKGHGFPIQGLTFDGDAISYRVGAEITGKEYNDFHGTFTKNTGSTWYQWGGKWGIGLYEEATVMEEFEPKDDHGLYVRAQNAELPIVFGPPSANLEGEEGAPGGQKGERPGGPPSEGKGEKPKFGMLPDVPVGVIPEKSPIHMRQDKEYGPPIMLGGATAGMSIHKSEGVFPKKGDVTFSSCVDGLYAAGDALGSMLLGATYSALGMSSSASCVQGSRAGLEAADYCDTVSGKNVDFELKRKLIDKNFTALTRPQGYDPNWVIKQIQNLMMPFYVIYVKEEKRLLNTLETLGYIRDNLVPNIVANDTHELKLAHEAANIALNAEMKLRASLFRTETRGTHYREDYPKQDDDNWQVWTVIKQGTDGDMGLRKVDSK